jgi:hypothetical protein
MQFLTLSEVIENYHDYNDHMGADSTGFLQVDEEDDENTLIYINTILISCGNKICKYVDNEPVFLVFDYPGNPPETKEHIARLLDILRYNSAPFYLFNISYEYYYYEVEELKEEYREMVFNMVDEMKMKEIKKVLLKNEYMQPDVYKYVFLPLVDDYI